MLTGCARGTLAGEHDEVSGICWISKGDVNNFNILLPCELAYSLFVVCDEIERLVRFENV